MILWESVLIFVAAGISISTATGHCPTIVSCSIQASLDIVDPCCVPAPAGLFLFRQRFEPDVNSDAGNWGIDGIEVLECDSQATTKQPPYSPAYTHEEIGSFCLKSGIFDNEEDFVKAEGEWTNSEVGEGVEEIWERTWMTAGRYISTLAPACLSRSDDSVAGFFHAIHHLHADFPTGQRLADSDITPSSDVTYSLAELVAALSVDGFVPVLSCDNTTLISVSWPLHVQGTFQDGIWRSAIGYSTSSNCPAEGVRYPPSQSRPQVTSTTFDPIYRPTPRPVTLTNDPSRLYPYPDDSGMTKRPEKFKLGFFKQKVESRERDAGDEPEVERQRHRDEL